MIRPNAEHWWDWVIECHSEVLDCHCSLVDGGTKGEIVAVGIEHDGVRYPSSVLCGWYIASVVQ